MIIPSKTYKQVACKASKTLSEWITDQITKRPSVGEYKNMEQWSGFDSIRRVGLGNTAASHFGSCLPALHSNDEDPVSDPTLPEPGSQQLCTEAWTLQ